MQRITQKQPLNNIWHNTITKQTHANMHASQQVQCTPKVMLGLLCSMLHLSPSIKCPGVTQSLECTAWRWKWTRYNSWRQESIANRIMLDGQQGIFSLMTTGCHHSSTSTHPQSCDTISGRCPLDPPNNTCDWAVHTHYKLQPGFLTTSTRVAVHHQSVTQQPIWPSIPYGQRIFWSSLLRASVLLS